MICMMNTHLPSTWEFSVRNGANIRSSFKLRIVVYWFIVHGLIRNTGERDDLNNDALV